MLVKFSKDILTIACDNDSDIGLKFGCLNTKNKQIFVISFHNLLETIFHFLTKGTMAYLALAFYLPYFEKSGIC